MVQALAALIDHPQKICFESQADGEEILLLLRRHWFTQLPRVLLILALAIVPLVLASPTESLVQPYLPRTYTAVGLIMWYLGTLMVALESYVNWYFNVFIITKTRVVDINFWGLLYKNVSEAEVTRIEDTTYTMGGVFQSLFNYGDINIQTAAEEREFVFEGCPDPAHVHEVIAELADNPNNEPYPHL